MNPPRISPGRSETRISAVDDLTNFLHPGRVAPYRRRHRDACGTDCGGCLRRLMVARITP
jgi:hypothetical protein